MKIKKIFNFTKRDARQYLVDNKDCDIVFNIKPLVSPILYSKINYDYVSKLFEPLLQLEKLIITIDQMDTLVVTNTLIIRYYIMMVNEYPDESKYIYDLKYYFQTCSWHANFYLLEDASKFQRRQIYSEMRNVSLNPNSKLEVIHDSEILGFATAIDSRVFPPVNHRIRPIRQPKLCSNCYYYTNEYALPCAVNPIHFENMNDDDGCKEYKAKVKSFDIT